MADQTPKTDVVIDKAQSSWSDLWKKEDYLAIWLGLALLFIGMGLFLPSKPEGMDEKIAAANATMEAEAAKAPFKTVAFFEAQDVKSGLKAKSQPFAKDIANYMARPKKWSDNPMDAFFMTTDKSQPKADAAMPKFEEAKAKAATAKTEAIAAQEAAAAAGFTNQALNTTAQTKIDDWRKAKKSAGKAKGKTKASSYNLFTTLPVLMIGLGLFMSIGIFLMGKSVPAFLKGFVVVFIIGVIAYVLAGQSIAKSYGIGYAAWAIAIGMLIANTVGTPKWVKPGLEVEFYIKTGLVLLGAEVLFSKILSIGVPGIFVAWVVTPVVLITTFIFGQKVLKIPSKTLNMVVSADMSVCGTSAAIATAAACRAKKEELTLAIGLSLIFTSIMMIVMPAIIKAVEMPHVLGGAWMGGTIDATGAVAAAGAFLSERAMYVAATIKMIQNVLIGVTAFGVAVYWCTRVDCVEGQKVSAMEIWHRFPKFVLGFLAASVLMSYLYSSMGPDAGYSMIDQGVIGGFTKYFRGWFFCFSFVAIGLATNFRELAHYFKGGKPLILYVCGQSFNLMLTLTMAYIMFYLVFPDITAKI